MNIMSNVTSKPKWWLAVLALVLAPAATAVAHDYDEEEENGEEPDTALALFDEDVEEEAEEHRDEHRDEHGFEEHEEAYGHDSAEAAAEAFMTALKEQDAEKMKTTVPPEEREEFERIGKTLMEASTLHEYEITSVEVDDEEMRATASYTWEIEIDKDKVVEGYTEVIRGVLRDEGLTEEEIESILEVEMEPLREDLRNHMEELEKKENRMTLEKIEERWYVTSPIEDEPDVKAPDEWDEEMDDVEEEEEEEVEEEEERY